MKDYPDRCREENYLKSLYELGHKKLSGFKTVNNFDKQILIYKC